MRMARRVLSLTGVALVATCLAGCGTEKADAAVLVRDAPAKTTAARTARFAMSVESTSSTAAATAASGDGVIDLSSQTANVTIDPKIAGQSAKMRMLVLGTTMYIQVPDQLKAQAGGKSFMKLDLSAVAKEQGVDLAALAQQRPDPGSDMAILTGAGSDFTKVGTDTLRGASTTHFRGTVDIAKAQQNASPEAKASVAKIQQTLGTSTIPMDVWLDGKGRLRKMTYSVDLGKAAAAAGRASTTGQLTETMELYDYGVPVNVTAPPADQVVDITNVAAPTK